VGALKGALVRLRALVRGSTADRELNEEIRFHLEQEAAKNVALGMDPDTARQRALATFGGVRRVQEDHREARGLRWLEDFVADVRFALRGVRRAPALTAAAVITLGLGVGANTAIFSAVNAVILQPLPFPNPERLMMLWEENPEKNWHMSDAAPANVLDWKERVRAFEDVAAYTNGRGTATLTGEGTPQLLMFAEVTGNFFSVLGARAALGRTFQPEETWATPTRVAVISHRAWQDRFGGDPRIIGRTVRLYERETQIVGVMPEDFAFPYEGQDLWMPMRWDASSRAQDFFRRAHYLRAIARLRPSVTQEQANAQLQQVANQLKLEYPAINRYMGAGMTPLHEFLVGDTRRPLLVLLGAVGVLLLIACLNVGNLMLVQATDRHREVSLRLALGAERGRVVRQAFAESLVLSTLGGALGLALGWAGTRAMIALQPAGLLRVDRYGVDWTVTAFVGAIVIGSALLFGTLPASWSGRRLPAESLKGGGRGGTDGGGVRRWGDALAIAEVSLALLLTVGAGLLVRTLWSLQHVPPGFDPRNVLTAKVVLPGARYDTSTKWSAFFEELERRAATLPRAESAALATSMSLSGSGYTTDFVVAGRAAGEYGTEILRRTVSPSYFATLRVPVRRGRVFGASDRAGSPPVIVINDALASSYFRGQDPVGQRIAFDKIPDSTTTWYTIIGVVGSERQQRLGAEPRIEAFDVYAQGPESGMTLAIRTTSDPARLTSAVRRMVHEMDPNLAILDIKTLEAAQANSLTRERFLMVLLLLFAGVGAALAVVGVYGVLANLARRRRREMGIRIALGAPTTQVRWLVVRHGLRLVWLGLVIGTVVALGATQAIRTLLYGVAPSDPLTYVGVAALLAGTALLAAWIPAAQASRANPVDALRSD
jgi:putative ABC transport system permease protein